MKEISEKLSFELLDMLTAAEKFSDDAYCKAKRGETLAARDSAMLASCKIFEARTHLLWHIDGYKHVEQKV